MNQIVCILIILKQNVSLSETGKAYFIAIVKKDKHRKSFST